MLVTGGSGMVGSAIKALDTDHEIVYLSSSDCDLRDKSSCFDTIGHHVDDGVDAVVHLAARVGGVKGNSDNLSDYFSDNISINTNVLNACVNFKIGKVVSLLSTCVYPDNARYPLTPDQIHNGPPHESNFGYAFAKRMLDVQSRAIRSQHGLNYVTAIPNNMYGPNDNFDIVNGHVIPSMIMKIWNGKINNKPVHLWGDGTNLREFTYSRDVAEILFFLLEKYTEPFPINIGRVGEVSIKELSSMICKKIGFDEASIIWDVENQRGQHRKPSDNSDLMKLGWSGKYTDLLVGLNETIDWFSENYPNVRGII